jgi:hypothetical protein
MNDSTNANPTAEMWASPSDEQALIDAECSPTKTCRNMVGISFDGFAEQGGNLQDAWRATLAAEGKLGGGSIADLVLGDA